MRLEISVEKVRSKWVAKVRRWPETLERETFNRKSDAVRCAMSWENKFRKQNRRFCVCIETESGRPVNQYGVDYDGLRFNQPNLQWRAGELRVQFTNEYGDKTLFLTTGDWTFLTKLIVDMKEKNNWSCEITSHGQVIDWDMNGEIFKHA